MEPILNRNSRNFPKLTSVVVDEFTDNSKFLGGTYLNAMNVSHLGMKNFDIKESDRNWSWFSDVKIIKDANDASAHFKVEEFFFHGNQLFASDGFAKTRSASQFSLGDFVCTQFNPQKSAWGQI